MKSKQHFQQSWVKGGQCIWLMTYHLCSAKTSRNPGP